MADSPTITAARLALRAAEEEQARALAAATAKSKVKNTGIAAPTSPSTPASPQADPTTPETSPAPLGVQPGVTIVQDPVTKTNVVEAPDTPPTVAPSQAASPTPASPQASSAPTTTSGGSETAEQTATDFSLAFGQAKVHVNALFTFLHNTGNAADLDLQGLETHLRALLAPMRTLLSKT